MTTPIDDTFGGLIIGDSALEIHFGKTLISKENVVAGLVLSFFERLLELHLDKIGFESQIMHLACRSLKSQKSAAIFCPKPQVYNESLMVGLINTLKHEFLKMDKHSV